MTSMSAPATQFRIPHLRMTLADVAREAAVSLATVDRVINRRGGVSARTVQRVEQALIRLGYRPDPVAARLARGITFRFCFVLPTGSNTFMGMLAEQVEQAKAWLAEQRAFLDLVRVDVFDPLALAAALDGLQEKYQGVAVVALDHPAVREAIDALVDRGTAVVTLVSDVPSSKRHRYVGINNSSAGRTAGTLMGRFAGPRKGPVGMIVGSLALRDHAERQFGFQQVIAAEYPGLQVLPAGEGRDDAAQTRVAAEKLLRAHPDLVGIYSAGAGNRGIVEALEAATKAGTILRKPIFIAHELTPFSRKFLMRGIQDAAINQDPGHEARSAARILLAHCQDLPVVADQERIRIDIFVRDNLP